MQHTRIQRNSINHWRKRGPPRVFHLSTNLVLGNDLLHSVGKTHVLVVTLEFIWLLFLNILSFNFVQAPNKSFKFGRFKRSYGTCPGVVPTNFCQSFALLLSFFIYMMSAIQSGYVSFLQLFVPSDSAFT